MKLLCLLADNRREEKNTGTMREKRGLQACLDQTQPKNQPWQQLIRDDLLYPVFPTQSAMLYGASVS